MSLTTSWMWATDDGDTNGAFIDLETKQIHSDIKKPLPLVVM
jgi:hypothetical protein